MEPIKLLIIDDDPDQQALLRETLETRFGGGSVIGVHSKREAMAQPLEAFDLILCDFNLPDGSGLDVLDLIRTRCDTPVIMVTGENVGQTAVDTIERGAVDYVVKHGDYFLTIPLVVEKNLTAARIKRQMEALQRELVRKNAELERLLRQVEQAAATDPLTGLYNRRHFADVLDQLFAEATRYGHDMSCVMIDMDGFKQINDTRGHQVGDALLVCAARAISNNMRRMDVAARYGGDEFVLLLPHADASEAHGAAKRIAADFCESSARLLKQTNGVNMSIGVASMHMCDPTSADTLVALADRALYDAKDAGRNRVMVAGVGSGLGAAENAAGGVPTVRV